MCRIDAAPDRHISDTRHRRRGVVLLLVLVFIVLAGTLAALTAAGTAQQVRTDRHHHEMILLRQLIDNGHVWVVTNRHTSTDGPIQLDAHELLPPEAFGQISISFEPGSTGRMIIEASVKLHGRHIERAATFESPR